MNETAYKDAICVLTVYHHADACYEVKARKCFLDLRRSGKLPDSLVGARVGDTSVGLWASGVYQDMLEDHTICNWPDGWEWTTGYYGERMLFKNPGWNAPKGGGYYTGDSCGMPKFFNSWQAVLEYTQESLEEITDRVGC